MKIIKIVFHVEYHHNWDKFYNSKISDWKYSQFFFIAHLKKEKSFQIMYDALKAN